MPNRITLQHPDNYLEPAVVTDRSDCNLAHLNALNFSSAWCLFEMGNALGNQKLIDFITQHFNYSYVNVDSTEYTGAPWLTSFATYAPKKK